MKAKVLGIEMSSNNMGVSPYVGLLLRASKDEIQKMLDEYKVVLIRAIGSAG